MRIDQIETLDPSRPSPTVRPRGAIRCWSTWLRAEPGCHRRCRRGGSGRTEGDRSVSWPGRTKTVRPGAHRRHQRSAAFHPGPRPGSGRPTSLKRVSRPGSSAGWAKHVTVEVAWAPGAGIRRPAVVTWVAERPAHWPTPPRSTKAIDAGVAAVAARRGIAVRTAVQPVAPAVGWWIPRPSTSSPRRSAGPAGVLANAARLVLGEARPGQPGRRHRDRQRFELVELVRRRTRFGLAAIDDPGVRQPQGPWCSTTAGPVPVRISPGCG